MKKDRPRHLIGLEGIASKFVKALFPALEFRDPPASSAQVYRVKQRYHQARISLIERRVEKIFYEYAGIECLCGNKKLVYRTELIRRDREKEAHKTASFRCAKCGMIPIFMSKTNRKFYNDPSSKKALEWIGVLEKSGKI